MVAHLTLDQRIGVRIPVPELNKYGRAKLQLSPAIFISIVN